ncbi:MAG TPA: hypothetical protein VIG37_25670 [Methylomirabilota bacterium]
MARHWKAVHGNLMRLLIKALIALATLVLVAGAGGAQPSPHIFGVLNQQSPALTAERWLAKLKEFDPARDRDYDGVRRIYRLIGQ